MRGIQHFESGLLKRRLIQILSRKNISECRKILQFKQKSWKALGENPFGMRSVQSLQVKYAYILQSHERIVQDILMKFEMQWEYSSH